MVVAQLRSRSSGEADASTLAVCSEPQQQFFQFRDSLDANERPSGNVAYYEYLIEPESGTTIRLRCLNSSLTSVLREVPGQLYFPYSLISTASSPATVDICIFHHPYNWYTPVISRAVRDRIADVSDLVLSGHEHVASSSSRTGSKGETNLYIEGGALQGDKEAGSQSSFNLLLIDTALKEQRLTKFDWTGTIYDGTEGPSEPYQANQMRRAGILVPNKDFGNRLDNPGLSIDHPKRGRLSLRDVFVYPDVVEFSFPASRSYTPPFSSDRIVPQLSQHPYIYIGGAEKSGKTCSAKRLFADAVAAGLVPILLDGNDLDVQNPRDVEKVLRTTFSRQYHSGLSETYLQLPKSRRLVIIDDFQKTRGIRSSLRELLNLLTLFAGSVVVIGTGLAQHLIELIAPSLISHDHQPFRRYRLLPFGHARKHELIERWCALDEGLAASPENLSEKLVRYKRVIDTAFANNILPAYPLFMLPLLQAQENRTEVDMKASTYGYFFELLIRGSLAKTSTKESFDVKTAYLSKVAYRLVVTGKDSLSDQGMRSLHEEFEKELMIAISFISLQADLMKVDVLVNDGESYHFAYPHIFYYFAASYIRDHIGEPEIIALVGRLADSIHQERSANILMFLAHVSKDPLISKELIRVAKSMFPERKRAELTNDEPVLPAVESSLMQAAYTDHGAESRRVAMAELDKQEQQQHTNESNQAVLDDVNDRVAKFSVAFKTLQILGQVVKNFPGSPGPIKKDIVDECYGIGLRALSEIFDLMRQESDEFVASIVSTQRELRANINEQSLEKKARDSIYGMIYLLTIGTIRNISMAVASQDLSQIYSALLREQQTPAVRLITAALKLELSMRFPEKDIFDVYDELDSNALAQSVVRGLSINHFQLVDSKYDTKQRVCARLEITYSLPMLSSKTT